MIGSFHNITEKKRKLDLNIFQIYSAGNSPSQHALAFKWKHFMFSKLACVRLKQERVNTIHNMHAFPYMFDWYCIRLIVVYRNEMINLFDFLFILDRVRKSRRWIKLYFHRKDILNIKFTQHRSQICCSLQSLYVGVILIIA